MSKVTAAKAKYFENRANPQDLYFCSNGMPFYKKEDADANASNLGKQGKSTEVVLVTVADYESWKAEQERGEAGGNAGGGDENKTPGTEAGGNAGAGGENKEPSAPADKEKALAEALAKLEEAKGAQALLAANASKAKKSAAQAAVDAAEALVAELSK